MKYRKNCHNHLVARVYKKADYPESFSIFRTLLPPMGLFVNSYLVAPYNTAKFALTRRPVLGL